MILGWDRSGQLPSPVNLGNAVLHRLAIPAKFGMGLRNLPNLLRWQWGLLWWLVKHRDGYEIIHACDFDTILPALLCKFLFRKRVVYDIFDFYADHLRRTPNFLLKLIRAADLRAVNLADALILVDEARLEQIRGARPKHWTAIYNSPEDQLSSFLHSKGTKTSSVRLRLAYVGLLQVERGLFEVFDLLTRHSDWYLDLAGFGGDETLLAARAEKLPNAVFHGRVTYDRALSLSAQADVLFATYDPAIPNHRYSSPNKIFEAMMLSKPIVVAFNTNMDKIIEAAQCGIIVPYGDVNALELALEKLAQDPELRQRLGQNGRRVYDEVYSWERMKERLIKIYQYLH